LNTLSAAYRVTPSTQPLMALLFPISSVRMHHSHSIDPNPVRAVDTAKTVQANIAKEEERIKNLMDEYQRTLQQLDKKPPTPFKNVTLTDLLISPTKRDIPSYKKAFVMPVIDAILKDVNKHIEEQEFLIQDAKENFVVLRQEHLLRETRIDRFSAQICLKE
jgi:hypothetical protein